MMKPPPAARTLRLSISNHTRDTIAEGLGRLEAAVADCRAGVAV
jgi:hypothetical protein